MTENLAAGLGEMTLTQFLSKLRRTPRKWEIRYGNKNIRCGDLRAPQCPLSYFTGDASWCYPLAVLHLRISKETGERIVSAADGADGHDPKLRAKLLKACGL